MAIALALGARDSGFESRHPDHSMKTKWFKNFYWFYLPVALPGYLITTLAILFCFNVFVAIDINSHSVSDMLYGIFPFFVTTFLLWDWIARKTS